MDDQSACVVESEYYERHVRASPTTCNKFLKVVDCRPAYFQTLPIAITSDVELQAVRIALRFHLKSESAQKIACLIADEITSSEAKPQHGATYRGISRVESPSGRWYARVYYPKQDGHRKTLSKAFYDNKFGGSSGALQAAINWRDDNNKLRCLHPDVNNAKGLSQSQFTAKKARAIVDGLLKQHGKVFICTGTGPLGYERARLMGQGGNTLNRIRHGKQNGFHLGQSRLRCEVVGFINPITETVEKEIRSAVLHRKRRWMSSEDIEDAVSACMLSWASKDLSSVDEHYIVALACSVIRNASRKHCERSRKHRSIDRNGSVDGSDFRQVSG